ncbi:MAG TPA: phenylalanine--tRNA ligase subunit beta [Gemmatimonadaceae bacterium]|nr:phenylalanine--tRNA ligase subunit beta [Gemmatimonadaceae bacterium]
MNASYEWLREFTDFDLTPEQLRDVITSRAATVEDVISLRADLRDVVVGLVVEARPHPNSDHLWVTKVDAGTGELLDVVCGAPNVQAGSKYPFAPSGSTLPGGLKLERRKIRGETSNGMLCSARELALGTEHDGILTLHTDAAPGTPFLDAFPAGDTRFVVDVLPNRPDLLSHEGLAREISAYTGNDLHMPEHPGMSAAPAFEHGSSDGTTGGVRVSIDEPSACPLYTATVIRGVRIAPSPEWLANRLIGIGLRPINNVVDATNYMLHGFGQPMHAFDLDRLRGPEIHVRNARPGERITTLDGVERKLDPTMTVIADADRAQAIAGVIGGSESAVSDGTSNVLLEVAVFDPRSVRSTRRALGTSTDASYRFERALDAHASAELARYAAALIISLAGGRVEGAPIAVGSAGPSPHQLSLRVSRVAKILGEHVSAPECMRLLGSVGFGVNSGENEVLRVTPPRWRSDVTLEVDLIEEVARLRGYDSFSDELRPFRVGSAPESPAYVVTRRVTRALVQAGMMEVRAIPFVADAGEHGVRVLNPLAESEALLRTSALQTLARRVEHNFAHMTRNVRLFEVGVVFSRGPDNRIPIERTVAAAVLSGDRSPAHFTDPRPAQLDIWDAKWIAETIVRAAFGQSGAPGQSGPELQPNAARDGWDVVHDGSTIGTVGPITVDAPVWAPPVFGIEIDLTAAFGIVREPVVYRPLPVTPAAEFDLALLVPADVVAADVARVIRTNSGEMLESLVPFDEFRGPGVGDGYRSIAWRLTFRHPERTLRDKEIEGRRARILRALNEELGVRPRTT